MRTPTMCVLGLGVLLGFAGQPAAGDDIVLTLLHGPGGTDLSWEGGVPNFEAFRSSAAASIAEPANSVFVTGGRQAVDAALPPAGSVFFYRVVGVGPCSPLDPATVCGSDERCYPTEDHLTACGGSTGAAGQGASCAMDSDCSPAHACVDVGGSSQCLQWCRTNVPGDCPTPASCFPLSPPLFAGAQEYGVCF